MLALPLTSAALHRVPNAWSCMNKLKGEHCHHRWYPLAVATPSNAEFCDSPFYQFFSRFLFSHNSPSFVIIRWLFDDALHPNSNSFVTFCGALKNSHWRISSDQYHLSNSPLLAKNTTKRERTGFAVYATQILHWYECSMRYNTKTIRIWRGVLEFKTPNVWNRFFDLWIRLIYAMQSQSKNVDGRQYQNASGIRNSRRFIPFFLFLARIGRSGFAHSICTPVCGCVSVHVYCYEYEMGWVQENRIVIRERQSVKAKATKKS